VIVAVTACGAPAAGPTAAPPHPAQTDVETTVTALLPQLLEVADIPGVAIAMLRDDQVLWEHEFGVADAATRRPVTRDTVFQAASLSKPVFAYAVMKLVDAGTLDLDRPLTSYLPGTYDVGADPRLAQITARHALSHTAGFPNWRTGALAIELTPGTQFSYSGEGVVYLAAVVEHITGEPFERFMQRTVLDPLGMTDSSYGAPKAGHPVARPHDTWGTPVGVPPMNRLRNPAAGLYTTAQDYARFVIAIRRGTGLSAAARQQMLTPQVQVIEGGPMSIGRANPRPRADLAWGLGWGLETTTGGTAFWHWGDNVDAKAFVIGLAEPKLSVILFANGANGMSIVREVLAATLGVPQPGLDWLGYESYDAPVRVLAKAIRKTGAEAALREYRAGRTARVPELQLNRLGYELAATRRMSDAIAVLAQNAADHPSSGNTYDSLAEVYELAGATDEAIASYQRSIELDPSNAHAAAALARLRPAAAP
jgi:CubicO group peptidase (beta-lactamase class C family)